MQVYEHVESPTSCSGGDDELLSHVLKNSSRKHFVFEIILVVSECFRKQNIVQKLKYEKQFFILSLNIIAFFLFFFFNKLLKKIFFFY